MPKPPLQGSFTQHTSRFFGRKPTITDAQLLADDFPQLVFDQGADGFVDWRPLESHFRFSPSFSAMLGYAPNRLPLNTAYIAAHIHCDDYATVKLFFAKTLLSGRDSGLKFRMIKQDASVSWFQMRVKVIAQNDNDQITRAIICVTNIDQSLISQTQAETKSSSNNDLKISDEQWLRDSIRQLLQRQDENATNDCLSEFCNRMDVDHIALRQAFQQGERYRLIACGHHQRHSMALDFSTIVLRKNMPYEFSNAENGEPVLIDDFNQIAEMSPHFKERVDDLELKSMATIPIYYHGNIDYYLSLMMTSRPRRWDQAMVDLANGLGDALAQLVARQRITQTLEQSEERFQNALEATQDGLWDWNVKTDVFYVSPSFLYMLGYDEEYVPLNRGKISKFLVPPTTLNDFFTDPGNGRGVIDRVMQFKHRQGHFIWLWVRAKHTEWNKDGKPTRTVGINVDITRFQASMDISASAFAQHQQAAPVSVADKVTNTSEKNTTITAPPLTPDEALRMANILLAEDNPINQQVAIGILKRKGVNVTIVNNGQEAIDILQSSPPHSFDLVLMDMEMPVLDGYAATRQLRDNRLFKDLPIIALTAHAREEDRRNCLRLGMNDHVAKPVKPDVLYNAIAKQLSTKQQSTHH